jgi:DNA-binding NarL/FixJ family response regulator
MFRVAGMQPAAGPATLGGVILRCLIVDDSLRFLDAAGALLRRQAIEVVGVASTGAEALQKATALRPDVTLVDIDLGGESGFDVARRLRRDAGPVPVILISTHVEDDYVDLIEASPALGFLSKSALSGRAIRDLLDRQGDGGPPDRVNAPRGT